MRRALASACFFAAVLIVSGDVSAETLKVGPRQRLARPSDAFRAAREGDVIEIDSAGEYGGDVGTINANKLTVRGVGNTRVNCGQG